jgi:EpsI family protein
VLGVAAVAAVWPLYAAHLERDPGRQAIAALANPAPAAGWAIVDSATDWRPQYVGAAASTFQVYRKGDDTVAVYLGYYRDQRQGAELISSQNTVQALPRWHYAASGARTEDLGGGALEVRQTELRGPAQRLLVWEWFRIGESELANPYVAKALLARDKLLGRGDASAVIILAAPFDGRTQATIDSLRRFARDMRPSLLASLASLNSAQPE